MTSAYWYNGKVAYLYSDCIRFYTDLVYGFLTYSWFYWKCPGEFYTVQILTYFQFMIVFSSHSK